MDAPSDSIPLLDLSTARTQDGTFDPAFIDALRDAADVPPPPGVDRYTIPLFFSPRLDAVIETVPLPPALAARSRGVTDDPDNSMLASYGANVLKGWLRAHPEVARIHHPELVRTAGQP
jgi:hypothetical protein